MSNTELTVRVQPLGEQWITLGTGEFIGIRPEGFRASSNSRGSDTASFILRRDPGSPTLDLQVYTPVEVEIDSVLVWSGRIKETPINDGSDAKISVECEGWQYHLDDDHYERTYVHSKLSDWKDTRGYVNVNLNFWPSSAAVTVDRQINLGFAKDVFLRGGSAVGVTLDLGPDPNSWARYVAANALFPNLHANMWFFCRGSDTIGGNHVSGNPTNYNDAWAVTNPTNGLYQGAFPGSRRYVHIFYYFDTGDFTPSVEYAAWLTGVRVFSENSASFHSSGTSALKASTVVSDALTKALPKLSTDASGIETTAFVIPEFSMLSGPRTPREITEAVNAFHDYIYGVDVNRKLQFKAKPTVPSIEIGSWSGIEFTDASANSGEEMYNKVTVSGNGVDSEPIRVVRRTAGLSEVAINATPISTPSLTNPHFNANVNGWSSNASLSWVNDVGPDGSTGYAQAVSGSSGTYLINSVFNGTFLRGHTYKVTMWALAGDPATEASMTFGVWGVDTVNVRSTVASFHNVWRQYTLFWTPTADRTGAEIRWDWVTGAANTGYVDAVVLYESSTNDSLLSRLGMTRSKILPIQSALSTTTANQIGDVFLRGHRTTPFKGSFTAQGRAVRRALGGAPVHASQLLLAPSQLVRVSHRIDPDTGALGRDGTMASVEYDHDQEQASVQVDNQRRNFEAFIERLAVVTGSALQS